MKKQLIPGAEPFYLKTDGKVACLLVHGFTSTAYDVRACGEYLTAHGIATKGVLVAGHGTSPRDLAKTNLDDWLNSIRTAYQELKKDYPIVYVLGISLGGNFLATLAQELNFAGIIFIGVPLKFKHEKSYKALYYAYRALGINYQRKWYQKSLDPQIRKVRPNYKSIPLISAPDVLKVIEMSRTALPGINCPVLAVQSTTDHAVDDETISTLQNSINTKDFQVMWVENRYHVVLIDHGKEEVFERINKFISEHQAKQ
ncbi:MAG: alpha/beta fold hydrolase [bacterium]|nr:alpha/beta fold hydrolase [bacterium]